jgi:hypothetical protein
VPAIFSGAGTFRVLCPALFLLPCYFRICLFSCAHRFEVALFLSQLALVGVDVDRVEDRLLEQIGQLGRGQGVEFPDVVGAILRDVGWARGVGRASGSWQSIAKLNRPLSTTMSPWLAFEPATPECGAFEAERIREDIRKMDEKTFYALHRLSLPSCASSPSSNLPVTKPAKRA